MGSLGPDPAAPSQAATRGEIKALLESPELRRIFDDEPLEGARPSRNRPAQRGRADEAPTADTVAPPAAPRASRRRRILVGFIPVYLALLILLFETVREPSLFLQIVGAPSVAEETHAMAGGLVGDSAGDSAPRAGMALRGTAVEAEVPEAAPLAESGPDLAGKDGADPREPHAATPAPASAVTAAAEQTAGEFVAADAGDAAEPPAEPTDAPPLALVSAGGEAAAIAPELPEEVPVVLAAGNLPLAGRPYPDPRAGLAPVAAPIDPAAAEAAEEALGLSRNDRREVQRRLRFAGSDPTMIDGVFGPATRSAITAWQEQAGIPTTGFMDEPAMAILVEQTADRYRDWRAAERARAKEKEAQSNVVASSTPPRHVASDPSKCRRLSSGEIAFGQDVGCNFRAFGENFKRDLRDLKGNLRQLFD